MPDTEPCEHPTTTLDDMCQWVICVLCGDRVKYNPALEPPMGYCDTRD
jgi:hypothetical protein